MGEHHAEPTHTHPQTESDLSQPTWASLCGKIVMSFSRFRSAVTQDYSV